MEYQLTEKGQKQWEELVSKGYTFHIFPTINKQPSYIWCKIIAKFEITNPELLQRMGRTINSKDKTYFTERLVSNELPFWVQFEDLIFGTYKIYHEKIIGHMSGRLDDNIFNGD